MASKKNKETSSVASDRLRAFIESIERLTEEKQKIADLITDVFGTARSCGFDTRTMKALIKLRAMDPADREEYEALLDIYKGALGMLNGTPLGEAARRRLEDEKKKKPDPDDQLDIEKADKDDAPPVDEPAAPEEPAEPQPSIDDAREMARQAAKDGRGVSENPFPARDPRRAAWDEEWCRSTGSDGMDLPDAWKRKPKGKDSAEKGA